MIHQTRDCTLVCAGHGCRTISPVVLSHSLNKTYSLNKTIIVLCVYTDLMMACSHSNCRLSSTPRYKINGIHPNRHTKV